jgi:DNA-directed RNA polymerase specialized sigma24 family protein
MVLSVCRQLLLAEQHAEDAFQAVFFILAQKARSIREPELLGNWLYGVALRTARCARRQIMRRRYREEGDVVNGSGPSTGYRDDLRTIAGPAATTADQQVMEHERAEALHWESDRAPSTHRGPQGNSISPVRFG